MLQPCLTSPDPSADIYLASLGSEHSRRTLRTGLELVAHRACGTPYGRRLRKEERKGRKPMRPKLSFCPWGQFRREHVVDVRAWLAEKFSPATASTRLYALRGALREAWRAGRMSAEDLAHCLDAAKPVRGTTRTVGKHVDVDELARLFATCTAPGPLAARDAAVLGLLWGGGLRRSEVCSLDLADYDAAQGTVQILGKGQKLRVVPLPPGSRQALDAWVRLRGSSPGPLVCPVLRGGNVHPERRLVAQTVQVIVEKRAAEADLVGLKPHDGRRWTGGTFLDVHGSSAAQLQLGHSSPATVSRHYDLAPMRRMQTAAARVVVPYAAQKKARSTVPCTP